MTSHQFGNINKCKVINPQSNVWVEDNINNKNNDKLSIKAKIMACQQNITKTKVV